MTRFLNPWDFNQLIFGNNKARWQSKEIILFRVCLLLVCKLNKISKLKYIIFGPCYKCTYELRFILKSKKSMESMLSQKDKLVVYFCLLCLFKYLHLFFEVKCFFFNWLHVIPIYRIIILW